MRFGDLILIVLFSLGLTASALTREEQGMGFDVLLADAVVDQLPAAFKPGCSGGLVRDPRNPGQILLCTARHCLLKNWLGRPDSRIDVYLGAEKTGDFDLRSKAYLKVLKTDFQSISSVYRDFACAPIALNEEQAKAAVVRAVRAEPLAPDEPLIAGGFPGGRGPHILRNCAYEGPAIINTSLSKAFVLVHQFYCKSPPADPHGFSGASLTDSEGRFAGVMHSGSAAGGEYTFYFSSVQDLFGAREAAELKAVTLNFGARRVIADLSVDGEGRILYLNARDKNYVLEARFTEGRTGETSVSALPPRAEILQRQIYLNGKLKECRQLKPFTQPTAFSPCE
jgi:hypothetical protein